MAGNQGEKTPRKNRYQQLSIEERRVAIDKSSNARKRRQEGESSGSNKRKNNDTLPVVSILHELKKAPACIYCKAKKFEFEPPFFCCSNGQVMLTEIAPPEALYILLTSQTEDSIHFRQHIRAYNSIFAFTSFGVNLDKNLASSRQGVYTFRAQGQIYHDLPSLIPTDRPKYFQLYFYDTDNELRNRKSILQEGQVHDNMLQKLMLILQANPYAKTLRSLKDFSPIEELELRIASNVKLDQRVYNKPTADQVAAIWIEGNHEDVQFEREIIIHAHSGNRHRIKHYFSCYDPLQYPVLFPYGEAGWHQDIRKRDVNDIENFGTIVESNTVQHDIYGSIEQTLQQERPGISQQTTGNVSCREYYCYKLQIRPSSQSTILFAGRLLQQFVVDMYIKLETTRLDFYRKKQSQIRAELYQGIVDSVVAGETRGTKIGKRIVLPGTFVGGPRDMRRRFANAMALVQRFGKPDLFITMTCNPEWKEIRDELKEGQRPQDRPDLTSRIFRAKLQDLKDQLFKKEIFGPVAAYVYVIEFQKRGLPHAHLLIILKAGHKINSPDQYDKFVCAEIPNEQLQRTLHDTVVRHMMHGPCGDRNRKNSCMIKGECKFHYPRVFTPTTIQGNDAYAIYRRRDNGRQVTVRNATLDNRWVVPYNPYLLSRYNCHINVEICAGIKAVKYLYKYIYKGHDKAAVQISSNADNHIVDEIQEYQDARWVSAQESMWRIFEFKLSEMYPSVINLQLHLPNKHLVSYWEGHNLSTIVHQENSSKTMLTEFFTTCRTSPAARHLLYKEFPEHYVWQKQSRKWEPRKKGVVVARINAVSPAEGERYYLRLLLNNVRGPTSFQDLLTVERVQYTTFKKAAQERGLLESDNSVIDCLDEASTFEMPFAIRRLFATILVYCEPPDVRKLWDTYFDTLSEDFRSKGYPVQLQIQETLTDIKGILESMGKNIEQYDLPDIDPYAALTTDTQKAKEIIDEENIEVSSEDLSFETTLNPEQKAAFDCIISRINANKGGVFFVDGPGGTGKTFLYRALLANVRSKGNIALATATSGVAASILPGGRTAHSRFGIPLQTTESTMCNVSKQSAKAELLRRSKLIIWDEAPMAKRYAIEAVDKTLRDILENNAPFGGKVFVFGGDFRQVLPVVPRATRQQTINVSLARSYIWDQLELLKLTKNMRALSDEQFANFILKIGDGEEPTIDDDLICLPEEMVIPTTGTTPGETMLIQCIFPELHLNFDSPTYVTDRAILATKNEHVDGLNTELTELFPGDLKTYMSFDEAVDDTNNYYQEEFLNTLLPNGVPPHKLILKKNCPIMLLRNLDPANGLTNGTRMVCKDFGNHVIRAELTTGHHAGKQVLLPRIPLSPANDEGFPFKFKRKQFPIRLCFAMTINKAQGQTIPHVGVYLPKHVFSHGQLYVALSRGISMSTTKVLVKPDGTKKGKTYIKNIVYKELLLNPRIAN